MLNYYSKIGMHTEDYFMWSIEMQKKYKANVVKKYIHNELLSEKEVCIHELLDTSYQMVLSGQV